MSVAANSNAISLFIYLISGRNQVDSKQLYITPKDVQTQRALFLHHLFDGLLNGLLSGAEKATFPSERVQRRRSSHAALSPNVNWDLQLLAAMLPATIAK